MAKLSYFLRKNGKATDQTVCVRHSHKGNEFIRTTGITTLPIYFDTTTGKVSNKLPIAPEWNATIQRVANDMETVSRDLVGKGIEPDKAAMTKAYEELQELRQKREVTAPKAERLSLKIIDLLKLELAELEQQVLDKKKEIEREELKMGIHEGKLLSKYITAYAKDKEETQAVNTVRLYRNVANVVAAYNPTLRIDQVTDKTLKALEKWLIAQGKKNLTITDTITKIKTVIYANAKELNINTDDIKDHKTDVQKKRNPNVVYLSKQELQDLIDLPLGRTVEIKIRDRFVLMCLLGVRYSDSAIKPENIFNNDLLVTTEKTDTDITIPMSQLVKDILKRYDNNIAAYPSQHFNKIIKDICSRVGSLQHKIQLKTYAGKNKPVKTTTEKYKAITAHVARRTFINLALERGVSPVTIAGIVGHEGTDLIMNVYGSSEVGKDKIMEMMD